MLEPCRDRAQQDERERKGKNHDRDEANHDRLLIVGLPMPCWRALEQGELLRLRLRVSLRQLYDPFEEIGYSLDILLEDATQARLV